MPRVNVPTGACGNHRVERFTISAEAAKFENLRASFSAGGGRRYVEAGEFTRLMRGHTVVMSDTPAEMMDHLFPLRAAKGHILINGLGIGMVLNACLLKPEVTHATVIEQSADVIMLVAPHYRDAFGDRLAVVHADAMTFDPPKGERYGMVWHDIWDNICADNLPQMHTLHRKYGRRAEWQGSWCRELCEYYSR